MIFPRLRDCREDNDYTQVQIAALLGIDQRVYSNYETGKRTIPIEHLIVLAEFYKTSIDYLIGFTGETHPYPRITQNR